MLEEQVPGNRDRGRLRRRWMQGILGLLHKTLEEADRTAPDQGLYGGIVDNLLHITSRKEEAR